MTRDEQWLLKEKYNGQKTMSFLADCERLTNGEPLAYVIGHIPFLNTTIHLTSRPLIPRTETEFWTECAIKEIKGRDEASVRVLDLCAGSGCIGVATLKALPQTTVDFVEIDTSHHATIHTNIEENGIPISRTQIFDGNLFENVTDTYDYILTNPPYIDAHLNRTEESVIAHEPALALWGGLDGMDIIQKILATSPQHLTEDGVLYIEHEPEQAEAIHEHGQRYFHDIETFVDQFGVSRFTRLSRPLK
jgi:HemK-like putative methylase